MTTQQKILTATMRAIHQAYYSGCLGERNGDDTGGDGCMYGDLWIHEGDKGPSIFIDLYNFEGDGKDVCEGLEFDTELPTGEYGEKEPIHLHAFGISYDPDWESQPLLLLCEDKEEYDFEVVAEYIPDIVCANITCWLREQFKNKNFSE